MKVEMLMPQMGESIAEATISKWRKKPGDSVQKDEVILEISTDKVDSEIPAPAAGTLAEVLFSEGDVVPVKTKIAIIDTAGGAAAAPSTNGAAVNGAGKAHAAPPAAPTPVAKQEAPAAAEEGGRFFSPLVKGLAEKHGVSLAELESVPGSGQGGRLTKEDFLKYVESRGSAPAAAAAAPAARPTPAAPAARPSAPAQETPSGDWGTDGTRVVMMDGMRQAIADHMVRSKHTSPHVYSIQEVDVTNIANWRAKHKGAFEKSEGFSLSFTPFFLEATTRALEAFPFVNASVDGKKIILKKHVNLGCEIGRAHV